MPSTSFYKKKGTNIKVDLYPHRTRPGLLDSNLAKFKNHDTKRIGNSNGKGGKSELLEGI